MSKNTVTNNLFHIIPIIPMGATGSDLPAKEIKLLGKFQQESFKTED